METVNIISAIFIYLILPLVIIIGLIIFFRRHRDKKAGRINSLSEEPLSKKDLHDVKEDEGKVARHQKQAPKNIDPETGRQPNDRDKTTRS